jgi:hypothetical protein
MLDIYGNLKGVQFIKYKFFVIYVELNLSF